MHRLKFGSIIGAIALAAGLMAMAASPAGAIASGCTPTATGGTVGAGAAAAVPGAEIGQWPANASSQSFLRIACTFTTAQSSSKYTIHDFADAFYHQGEARNVVTASGTAVGSSTITLTAASSSTITGFVNHGIAGQGVPKRAFITAVNNTTHQLTLNTPVVTAVAGDPTTGAIPAAATLSIDNGTSRSVNDGVTTNLSKNVTSNKSHFVNATVALGGDVGASITGTNIPDGATIATVTSATAIVLSVAATATGTAQTLSYGATTQTTTARTVNDATYTAGNHVTSAAAVFNGGAQGDIGMPVTGPGIAAGAVITGISGNIATLSAAVTVTSGSKVVAIGGPSRTAPVDGDAVINQGAELDLNPTLVAGSNSCSLNKPEGFGIEGSWVNPGSTLYNAALTFGTQPAASAAIGEVLFKTSVITFAAFIIQRPAGDTTIAAPHYDVTFPNVPTSLALCPASPAGIGNSYNINATTVSQAAIPAGVGRPSTAQLRGTLPATGTFTARFKSDDATKPINIPQNCVINATPTVDFHCGHG
jgi:hypothetical protein